MPTYPGGPGLFAGPPNDQPIERSPPQTSSQYSPLSGITGNTFFSPSVLAIIGILGAFFLLVSYYTIWVRYCTSRRVRHDRGREIDEDGGHPEASWPMLTRGLEESVIKMIPVCNFSKENGLVDGTDCAVCLSEFQENELLRLLPKCNHAFHLPCIDKWLQTHSNCPLCRANIISALPSPQQVEQPPAAVAEDGIENSQSPALDGSSQEEAGNRGSSIEQESHQIAVASISQISKGHLSGEQGGGDRDRDLKALQALKREDKFSARYSARLFNVADGSTSLGQMRSLSTGRTLTYKEEGRCKYGDSDVHRMGKQKTDHGSNPSSRLRRSYSSSTASHGRDVAVDLLAYRELQHLNTNLPRSGKAVHPVRAPSSLKTCNYESSVHATTNTPLHATDDIEAATGSTSRQLKNELKSKSFRYESKSKGADASATNPVMGKMLQSLKGGPFGMKRSFSTGRVFSSFLNTNRA